MPVLIVSEKTWPHEGFSRKRSIAAVLVRDDDAELERVVDRLEADRDGGPFSRWNATSFARSMSQSASPEMTRKVSSSFAAREPHGAGRAHRRLLDRVLDRAPSDSPSPK